MAGSPQQSGSSGNAQKGPKTMGASSSCGPQHVKGGASMKCGPKGGPRAQQSGSRGG